MRDILDIRRNLSMMESAFPKQLENAFKGMERNMKSMERFPVRSYEMGRRIDVPTIEQNTELKFLWWVGCAPATDLPCPKKLRKPSPKILNTAGVNYAVLGKNEACTGDPARRAGREDIFFGLASQNV